MRTTRRQELRTNELAEQIDELVLVARRYSRHIVGGAIVAAVVLIGGYVFVSGRAADREQAWADLYDASAVAALSPADQMGHYQRIEERNISPMLTALARLRRAELARDDSTDPKQTAAARAEAAKQAQTLYTSILQDFPNLAIAASVAELQLGVLAENRGDFAAAQAHYQKLIDTPAYGHLPAAAQAGFRLANLKSWVPAVEFPPPLPRTTQPASVTTAPAASTNVAPRR